MSLVKRTNDDWLPTLLNDMFQTDWLGGTADVNNTGVSVPAVNIQDKEDYFEIALAAPGKKKEDFSLELDNEILTISAEKVQESASGEKEKFTRKEFSYSEFKRSFTLPETVDNEAISASYEAGILKVRIPKKEEAKPAPKRLIEIA